MEHHDRGAGAEPADVHARLLVVDWDFGGEHLVQHCCDHSEYAEEDEFLHVKENTRPQAFSYRFSVLGLRFTVRIAATRVPGRGMDAEICVCLSTVDLRRTTSDL